ncbi:MAG: D-alanyl-D-alanine carboxypeptidase [Marivivens sp.]|nr:D-alanyl-D-alanine carboxypeptidase [Marivivens sp.]
MSALAVVAAPYAALVMDARTGEVLHSRNADTRLHPASLTKMMTLYIAFQAVERGEIGLDTEVTITREAANEPPSKLGLRAGQKIRLRYLLRAAAVKSANDAATAIGVALEGSEAAFAGRMNRMAEAMGMTRTTFRNAHGLTESGHLSTARDMTILGRHVIYDFPEYYNLFSRESADAGIGTVRHTNRRFLRDYAGADGIKTGYTSAAGFNLTASAVRGNVRIIATMFGGSSTSARNARVAELLDMGFARAPTHARLRLPPKPDIGGAGGALLVSEGEQIPERAGKVIAQTGLVTSTIRPRARPNPGQELLQQDDTLIASTVAAVIAAPVPEPAPEPEPEPDPIALIANAITDEPEPGPAELVTRISTSGGRLWGINVGRFNTRYEAERVLLQVALNEMSTLEGALRRVTQGARGFDANFMGLSRDTAELACRRLQARGTQCFMIGSDG